LRQDIASNEAAIRQNRQVIAQSSEHPGRVSPGNDIPGSAAKVIAGQEDTIRFDQATLTVLQCWARQPAQGDLTGGAKNGRGGPLPAAPPSDKPLPSGASPGTSRRETPRTPPGEVTSQFGTGVPSDGDAGAPDTSARPAFQPLLAPGSERS